MLAEGGCIFLFGFGYSYHIILSMVSAIECFRGPDLQKYLLVIHASYGIGGFLGPMFVYTFEVQAYFFFGISFLFILPFLLSKKSP